MFGGNQGSPGIHKGGSTNKKRRKLLAVELQGGPLEEDIPPKNGYLLYNKVIWGIVIRGASILKGFSSSHFLFPMENKTWGFFCSEKKTRGLLPGVMASCNKKTRPLGLWCGGAFWSTWVFPKIGGKPPKWMVKIMENRMKMDDLGGKRENPLFSETSTWMSPWRKLDGIKGDRIDHWVGYNPKEYPIYTSRL